MVLYTPYRTMSSTFLRLIVFFYCFSGARVVQLYRNAEEVSAVNFLDKLNDLMCKNSLNKSTLAKACGIPYTTIDGWYKKGYEGLKLITLRKLSSYFGTSLDYWVDNDRVLLGADVTDREMRLIKHYRARPDMQHAVDILLGLDDK